MADARGPQELADGSPKQQDYGWSLSTPLQTDVAAPPGGLAEGPRAPPGAHELDLDEAGPAKKKRRASVAQPFDLKGKPPAEIQGAPATVWYAELHSGGMIDVPYACIVASAGVETAHGVQGLWVEFDDGGGVKEFVTGEDDWSWGVLRGSPAAPEPAEAAPAARPPAPPKCERMTRMLTLAYGPSTVAAGETLTLTTWDEVTAEAYVDAVTRDSEGRRTVRVFVRPDEFAPFEARPLRGGKPSILQVERPHEPTAAELEAERRFCEERQRIDAARAAESLRRHLQAKAAEAVAAAKREGLTLEPSGRGNPTGFSGVHGRRCKGECEEAYAAQAWCPRADGSWLQVHVGTAYTPEEAALMLARAKQASALEQGWSSWASALESYQSGQ